MPLLPKILQMWENLLFSLDTENIEWKNAKQLDLFSIILQVIFFNPLKKSPETNWKFLQYEERKFTPMVNLSPLLGKFVGSMTPTL